MTRALALGAAIVALLAGAGSALAQSPEHNPQGKQLGVVEPRGSSGKTRSGGMVYHGGPVMLSNATYLVFWGPSDHPFDAGYVSAINQYFGDVAADSNKASNVYSVGTQYYDLVGTNKNPIQYLSTFSASQSVVDTNSYPASGCKDRYTTVCLTDAQLQQELQSVIGAHSAWSTGTGAAYFIFTPQGVGSCGSGVGCAFSSFCAYHSWTNSSAGTILYANMPYADTVPAACGSGQHPNGTTGADSTLDGASHEHNEMITDPVGTGWFTKNGYEQGDLCNFVYGPVLGGTTPTAYNQLINGDQYWIQEEWSNDGSSCLQHYP
jgi:serine protease